MQFLCIAIWFALTHPHTLSGRMRFHTWMTLFRNKLTWKLHSIRCSATAPSAQLYTIHTHTYRIHLFQFIRSINLFFSALRLFRNIRSVCIRFDWWFAKETQYLSIAAKLVFSNPKSKKFLQVNDEIESPKSKRNGNSGKRWNHFSIFDVVKSVVPLWFTGIFSFSCVTIKRPTSVARCSINKNFHLSGKAFSTRWNRATEYIP